MVLLFQGKLESVCEQAYPNLRFKLLILMKELQQKMQAGLLAVHFRVKVLDVDLIFVFNQRTAISNQTSL